MQLQKLPSIWTDSSVTISFPQTNTALDRSRRFEFGSIYYKDDPCKPKKKVDQFMFPLELLHNFRKCIRQASKSKSKEKEKHRFRSCNVDDEHKDIPPRVNKITSKLYQKPTKMVAQRDFFGNRCSYEEKDFVNHYRLPHPNPSLNPNLTPNLNFSPRTDSNQKIYITAAQRLDLSRPNNFNPGPGAYQLRTTLTNYKNKLGASMNSQKGLHKRRNKGALRSVDLEQK